ncbi:MAG TPA: ATP-binding cassette domain-containing protein [Acidimicrobiales bacterium]|nr:ATP-binding cassette domain-containing protein [Acidimicrobiales bacterium]
MSAALARPEVPAIVKPALQVSDLRVRFGGVQAVDGVSLEVASGAILGLIGPNGAGKTTIFDAISGLVKAEGKVLLAGVDISSASPERRGRARLGRSFQDARLFPSLTVAETLAVAFERHIRATDVISTALRAPWVVRAERKIRTRVDELIDLMGLGAFRDKFISELSTGSRRVVDLAATLAHDPLVLLLDEPSSGIAQREAEALGPLLLRIRDQTGASLLVVEHDMPLITSVSDEILALETGRVITRGRPEDVLSDPQVIASYLGTDAAAVARSGHRAEAPVAVGPVVRSRPGRAATKKAAVKRATTPRTTAPRTTAPRTTAPKTSAPKTAVKQAAVKKAPVKKAPTRKTTAKKTTAKKPGDRA